MVIVIKRRLKNFLINKNSTLLGVGPMSVNCVDASIEIADKNNIPLMLIASRRQVDAECFGGGYVNNWSTEKFSNYVRKKSKKKNIILCRDHGGPWQNNIELEQNLNLEKAMKYAKKSYEVDIKCNFEVIHIDPSIDPKKKIKVDDVLKRIFELYSFCVKTAKQFKKKIIIEIGTEEQSGNTNTPEDLIYTLTKIFEFCNKYGYQKPTFVVIQSGTRVAEMRNVGSFESQIRVKNELAAEIQVPQMIDICNKFDVLMKAHNTDYLSNESIKSHPKLGIHAVNVAPEFGVIETKTFVRLLEKFNLKDELKLFENLAIKSNKWKKWLLPNSKATKREKVLISGHYIYSSSEFVELKDKVEKFLLTKSINLDNELKKSVKKGIMRYVKNLNLI